MGVAFFRCARTVRMRRFYDALSFVFSTYQPFATKKGRVWIRLYLRKKKLRCVLNAEFDVSEHPPSRVTAARADNREGRVEEMGKKTGHTRTTTRRARLCDGACCHCRYYCDCHRQCSSPHQLISNQPTKTKRQMRPNTVFSVRRI